MMTMTIAQDRERCEVRYWLATKVSYPAKLKDHMDSIARKRGESARARLVELCRDQWQKGNRGRQGDWR
jgi:hypothetical protein